MAGEKGRDWWSVAIGLVVVGVVTGALWSWLDGSFSSGNLGNGLGPAWLVAISAAAVLVVVLFTRLSHRSS
jgi:hypothetical protein